MSTRYYMCTACGNIVTSVNNNQQCRRCEKRNLMGIRGRFDMRAVAGNVARRERL